MKKSGRWKLVTFCALGGILWNGFCFTVLASLLELPSLKTLQWQTVEFENCGTLRFPEEWAIYEQNGLVYVVDPDGAAVMTEIPYTPSIEPCRFTYSNAFFQDVTCLKTLSSAVFGNGCTHGRFLTEYNTDQSEQYYLNFGYDRSITLLIWDDRIDEAMVKDMAKTFVAQEP